MNARGTVRLPEYHNTAEKQVTYYTELYSVPPNLSRGKPGLCTSFPLLSAFRRQGVTVVRAREGEPNRWKVFPTCMYFYEYTLHIFY